MPDAGNDVTETPDSGSSDAARADASSADGISSPDSAARAPLTVAPRPGMAFRPCDPGGRCPTGFNCYTTGCLPAILEGESCHAIWGATPCVFGTSCVDAGRGFRCVVNGADGGMCRYGSPRCDTGLGCAESTHESLARCRPGLVAGELCGAPGDLCNEGSSCLSVSGTVRCVVNGAAGGTCRPARRTPDGELDTSDVCDAGLACVPEWRESARGYERCLRVLPAGSACGLAGVACAPGSTCIPRDGTLRCVANGAPGTTCRTESPECDDGAECGARTDGGVDRICRLRVPRGGACDPRGVSTACTGGDECNSENVADGGQCVEAGSAPGAACRGTEPRCDGDLRCSPFSRYRQTCRTIANVGDVCDLGGIRTLCPAATRCVPTAATPRGVISATCMVAIPDSEPNERWVPGRAPLGVSVLYRASLPAGDVEDCAVVRVAAGASLYVELARVGIVAGNSFVVSVLRSTGDSLGRWTLYDRGAHGPLAGSARLDPSAIDVLRDLPADDYRVCVRPANAPVADYTLAVGVM